MPAPRLLDKRVVVAEVASEKKRQIDQGITLAKKVDAVRTTLQDEERNLELFRSESLKRIQGEIDRKIAEKDSLERFLVSRREERIRLEAPIDLQEAWEEVRSGKVELASWKDRLTEQTIEQTAKEGHLDQVSVSLEKRNEEVLGKEILAEQTLQKAESTLKEADSTLEKAEANAKRINEFSIKKEQKTVLRELAADEREKNLTEREKANSAHEIDLSNREKALKIRYDTFVKAQAYITSKKNKS